MKILVLSDSHRHRHALESILFDHQNADEIVFLGDGLNDLEECQYVISGFSSRTLRAVTGNCDIGSFFTPLSLVFEVEGHRFLCTHGHCQYVKQDFHRLISEAQEKNCGIALFGHTHCPTLTIHNGITLFNPGSVAEGSYGLITIDPQTKQVEFQHCRADS